MIDWDRVAALKEDFGEEDFDELVGVFLEEVEGAITGLQDLSGTDDRVKNQMHFLKGCASNVGFRDLAELAASIEDGGGFDGMAQSVRNVFEQSRAQLLAGA